MRSKACLLRFAEGEARVAKKSKACFIASGFLSPSARGAKNAKQLA
jgi:hypothetical protein